MWKNGTKRFWKCAQSQKLSVCTQIRKCGPQKTIRVMFSHGHRICLYQNGITPKYIWSYRICALVWHNIQHLRKNLLEQCLYRMWWCLRLDRGLGQHVWKNSSIILIVQKWSTYTVVIKKSKDNGLKSVYYAFKRLKKYTTHYVIKACTLYERLNRSPYITTQAFFARKNPNLAKSLASFNTFCHAIITFVDTKITWFNSPRRVFSVGGK